MKDDLKALTEKKSQIALFIKGEGNEEFVYKNKAGRWNEDKLESSKQPLNWMEECDP